VSLSRDVAVLSTGTSTPPESTAQGILEDLMPPGTPSDHAGTTEDSSTKKMTFHPGKHCDRAATEEVSGIEVLGGKELVVCNQQAYADPGVVLFDIGRAY
jgi:hypothetical protein